MYQLSRTKKQTSVLIIFIKLKNVLRFMFKYCLKQIACFNHAGVMCRIFEMKQNKLPKQYACDYFNIFQ